MRPFHMRSVLRLFHIQSVMGLSHDRDSFLHIGLDFISGKCYYLWLVKSNYAGSGPAIFAPPGGGVIY